MLLRLLRDWDQARRDQGRRVYYARREAQALRMQYGVNAEAHCREKLAKPGRPERRKRYWRLVLKALETE